MPAKTQGKLDSEEKRSTVKQSDDKNKKDIVAQPKKKKVTTVNKQPTPPKLKLLFTVVNRDKADVFTALLESFEVNMQLIVAAEGTATTEMLHFLGYSDNKKAVIISTIREDRCNEALNMLDEKFKTIKGGKGIAFTAPMTGTIGVAVYQFLSNTLK